MTDTALIAVVAVVPPTLTALGGLFVAIRNGHKTDAVGKKAEAAVTKAEETASIAVEKTTEIHQLVNSNLDRVKQELLESKAEIAALHATVTALLEAGRAAIAPVPQPAAPPQIIKP